MTAEQFVSEMLEYWDAKSLSPQVRQAYLRSLYGFDARQLRNLLYRLQRVHEFQRPPKIAKILEVAGEMGYLDREPKRGPHRWSTSDCQLCGGEGRLTVYFRRLVEKTETGSREHRRLERIFRMGDSSQADWTERLGPGSGVYSFAYRCSCPAGELPTIDQRWPRWQGQPAAAPVEASQEAIPF